jgi:hypothetical protein
VSVMRLPTCCGAIHAKNNAVTRQNATKTAADFRGENLRIQKTARNTVSTITANIPPRD